MECVIDNRLNPLQQEYWQTHLLALPEQGHIARKGPAESLEATLSAIFTQIVKTHLFGNTSLILAETMRSAVTSSTVHIIRGMFEPFHIAVVDKDSVVFSWTPQNAALDQWVMMLLQSEQKDCSAVDYLADVREACKLQ